VGHTNENGKEPRKGRSIDFLGYVFNGVYTQVRKRNKKSFSKKLSNARTAKRRHEILAFGYGMLKHCEGKNLYNTITNGDMSFASKGIKANARTLRDGKQFYDVDSIRQDELVGLTFTVLSFVSDVKVKDRDGRYIMLIELDGRQRKVFTTSPFIIEVLLEAAAKERNGEKIFPVDDQRILKKYLGNGKSTFIFEE
jgi:hypothetical protein